MRVVRRRRGGSEGRGEREGAGRGGEREENLDGSDVVLILLRLFDVPQRLLHLARVHVLGPPA